MALVSGGLKRKGVVLTKNSIVSFGKAKWVIHMAHTADKAIDSFVRLIE